MTEKIVWKLLCVTVGVLATVGLSRQEVINLLPNPSFEDPIKGTWKSSGSQMTQYSEDKVHGDYAALCSQRKNENSGPNTVLPTLKKGGRYAFEGRVKVLQDKPGCIWQTVKVMMMFNATTDISYPGPDLDSSPMAVTANEEKEDWGSSYGYEGDPFTYTIAYRGFVRSKHGWITIAGDLNAPMKDFTDTRFAIRGPAAGVDFLLDNLTLWEVPEHPDWETQARINIDKYRKSDMQFRWMLG